MTSYPRGNGPVEWGTPNHIFDALDELYKFDLDPCAGKARYAKCEVHFTPHEDGLKQPWNGRVFLNPPYGRHLKYWMKKASLELTVGDAEVIVALIPASIGTQWFHEYVFPHIKKMIFVRGRVSFIDLDGTKNAVSANHDSIIVELQRNKLVSTHSIAVLDAKTGEWIQ